MSHFEQLTLVTLPHLTFNNIVKFQQLEKKTFFFSFSKNHIFLPRPLSSFLLNHFGLSITAHISSFSFFCCKLEKKKRKMIFKVQKKKTGKQRFYFLKKFFFPHILPIWCNWIFTICSFSFLLTLIYYLHLFGFIFFSLFQLKFKRF